MLSRVAVLLCLAAVAFGQQAGTNTAETHPSITWEKNGQSTQGKIVVDANWRWLHTIEGYTNCYTGNTWNETICPDDKTCAENCALDGADYQGTYGIQASGNSLSLRFVTNGQQKNVGSRTYLMADDQTYEIFKLLDNEFTFDVDVSKLPCGLNGALYFVEMAADGGMSANPGNKAGAKYGTGYCDAQCPRDLKFINGEANVEGWEPSDNDVNAGTGKYGACCNEMDIWEANSQATAYTPHPCQATGLQRCEGSACGIDNRYGTVCDPDGCDFNSYRMGDTTFFGEGKTVDTTKKFTVVTQFLANGGSLSEIRRIYVQDGQVIENSKVNIPGMDALDSVTDDFCDQAKQAFGDEPDFQNKGGLSEMGQALGRGMVLVLSIWDDHTANMLWLDSNYPTDADPSTPGIARGPCPTSSGVPDEVEAQSPDATVVFSNIKVGPIGSTTRGLVK